MAGLLLSLCFSVWANHDPIRHFNVSGKWVALTFDDGPSYPYTPQILDILKEYNIKATFYVLGGSAKAHPELIQRMIDEGHDIGNHSYWHKNQKNRSVTAIRDDVARTDQVIRELGYKGEITFRAPFGATSSRVTQAMAQLNKRHVLFNFLPQDWTKISAQKIYDNVMIRMRPGLIVTLHDGGKRRQNTVKATKMLIETLQAQGYQFCTVSQCLQRAP